MKNVLITKADGSSVNASVICYFKANDVRYVYYTLNELSQDTNNQTIKIYVAKEKSDNPAVDVPISEEDWTILKGYMSDVLKDAPINVEYLPAKENMIIVDEKGIAMPTSYNYVNKHAKIYEDSVANSDAQGGNVVTAAPVEPTPAPAPAEAPAPTPEAPAAMEATVADPPLAVPPTTQVDIAPAPEAEADKTVPPAPEAPAAPAEPSVPSGINIPDVNSLNAEEPAVNPFAQIEAPTTETSEAPAPEAQPTNTENLNGDKIDVEKIHEKYEEMRKELDELESKEKAAAESYNATLDLIKSHNEQHAEKVAESKEAEAPVPETPAPETPVVPEVPAPEAPAAPVAADVAPATDITSQVVAQETVPSAPEPTAPAVPEAITPAAPEAIAPEAPATPETPAAPEAPLTPPPAEPSIAPVSTVVPDANQELNAETNWFDMPENS